MLYLNPVSANFAKSCPLSQLTFSIDVPSLSAGVQKDSCHSVYKISTSFARCWNKLYDGFNHHQALSCTKAFKAAFFCVDIREIVFFFLPREFY